MLYGATIDEYTVPEHQPKSLQLLAALAVCTEINSNVHLVIEYPQNIESLPDLLSSKICQKLRAQDRLDFLKEEERKYRAMSKGVQGHYSDLVETEALEKEDVLVKHYFHAVALSVREHRAGNCGEYSALVVTRLIEAGYPGDRIMQIKGSLGWNNHVCIGLNVAPEVVAGDPASYGPNCVICDPWIDLVASASQYFAILEKIDMKFVPNSVSAVTERFW